jgi:hypothetical protein
MLLHRQAISPRLRFHPALIACTIALTGGLAIGPRLVRSFHESRTHVVHHQIAALEGDLFHAWHRAHPRATCPIATAQLSRDLRLDPWGTPFRVTCLHHRIAVTSAGPDRRFDTADDIRNHRR